jgi:hypothetical protein
MNKHTRHTVAALVLYFAATATIAANAQSVGQILAQRTPEILMAVGSLLASGTALILGVVNILAARRDRAEAAKTKATADKALSTLSKMGKVGKDDPT